MSDEEFSDLWKNLVTRAHKADQVPLSEHERCFYSVNLLRGSVPRSGFAGYFENFRVPDISAAHEGLRELGLRPSLAILERAQHIILAGRALPEDATLIEVIPTSLTEEEYERESDRIDAALTPLEKEFYQHEDKIWTALCEYAERHELKPRG